MADSNEITAYRPCVGVVLLNRDGLVWIGRRFQKQNDDGVGKWWQMPQGGIDEGEDPELTARREMAEETGVTSMELLAEAPNWYHYDLPQQLIGKSWKGRYRGQTQKWFAYRFTGQDSEVNLTPPGHKQEFDQWRWATASETLALIVPFKKPVYEQVMHAFRHLAAP
jgi:putative (di)nucleoside polyphosphate hydrolase